MFLHALNTAALGTATLFVLLALWRIAYSLSDWAVLALLAMAALLFLSHVRMVGAMYRARLQVMIRGESPLATILTGQLKAILTAFCFAVAAVPVLAWQALRADWPEAFSLTMLSLLAGLVLSWAQSRMRKHVHQAFVDPPAAALATWLVALPVIVLLGWVQYNYVAFPGEIRAAANVEAAAMFGIDQALPARRGWIAECLAPLAAWEAAKLWFITRDNMPPIVPLLFVVEAALVGFVVARAGVLATLFFQQRLGPKPLRASNANQETVQ